MDKFYWSQYRSKCRCRKCVRNRRGYMKRQKAKARRRATNAIEESMQGYTQQNYGPVA